MTLLESVRGPQDLKAMTSTQIAQLIEEIRNYLVSSVSQTGGHLGPNLGVVELTIALHRVFDSPTDTLIFDTGHQAYVHKLLTGRNDFTTLRQPGGLSGYPSRSESEHDVVENSHASTALSWADGVSYAYDVQGQCRRHTVAVIGDGAMTGGMAWEALNNIAERRDQHVVIVVNDNGRSYAPTIGGLAHHLDALRTNPGYERMLATIKRTLQSQGAPGRAAFDALHGLKRGLKDVLVPSAFFEDLGIKYTGPIDGHDEEAVEAALRRAREYESPVIVHVITQKGRGYTPAEEDSADRFHAVGKIHPETGLPVVPSRFGWTSVFADKIVELADANPKIVGLTAAMLRPVGLGPLAEKYPDRVVDVGIAEQHALTSAAGMAFAGLHPVVALYATFLNRAFDQVLMDVALHRAGVTIVLDRAGITGSDGPSHNGQWDMVMLRVVPGLQLAAPRDEATLREQLDEAVAVDDAPTVIRYPKGEIPVALPALRRDGGLDILYESEVENVSDAAHSPQCPDVRRIVIVGVGAMARTAVDVGQRLDAYGEQVIVVDPRWVIPVNDRLVELCADADLVVTIEDGVVDGGVGTGIREALETWLWSGKNRVIPMIRRVGIPREFIETDNRDDLLERFGMTADSIVKSLGYEN
ncbi:1-deoxy-D-xylulose-5-phosphate synthase [Actinomyces vulturis]|uniref:1-deoxy-D-xylulose-5-phosphate synthase n=1 Tax=Actinomyces vulturis TaxID=1857645 RepID=UPI0009F7190C|nr:1-deoxy-D-xylulose-5-phosphate synthase [Actinomyces vulturis]